MESSDDDYGEEEEEMEGRAVKIPPPVFFLKDIDKLAQEWGWEMLLPFKGSPKWSEYYSNYLRHYYRHHCSVIAEVTGNSLVHAAETCLKKEVELVSLWDRRMKECTHELLPRRTFILSSLILEFADKVKSRERLTDVPTAALLCITKEADLICGMLSFGAKPTEHLIVQSTEIRMCALGLANNQLCDPVPAAAAMVGIMKETTKICGWMSKHKKPFDLFDIDLDNDFELGRRVRQQTLHLMITKLEMFTFPVSASAEHKPVKEKTFSGNIPRSDGNDIAPPEAANTTGGNTQDQEKITGADIVKKRTREDGDQELGSCRSGSKLSKSGGRHCKFIDVLEKTWAWDRLLPLKSSIEWSYYCDYLSHYYKCNASVVAEVTSSLVASAELCLKKEEELVSLWKTKVVHSPIVILPVNTIVESNLILEHAHSIMFAKEGGLPVASTVAFACISKEADLMCELLKHGAKPTDGIIQQSSMIRMCALSLMCLQLQGSDAINAAAAMVGITKECKLMCDWMKKEDKLITFSFFARHELEECRLIRVRTLDVMLRILKGSSFPSSKMWLDLVASN